MKFDFHVSSPVISLQMKPLVLFSISIKKKFSVSHDTSIISGIRDSRSAEVAVCACSAQPEVKDSNYLTS